MASSPLETILLLTLALEEAQRGEHWETFDELLKQRGVLLNRLESRGLSPADQPLFVRVRQADARLMDGLKKNREALGHALREERDRRRMYGAYRPASSPCFYDGSG